VIAGWVREFEAHKSRRTSRIAWDQPQHRRRSRARIGLRPDT
jgi:hypothetical protein